MADRRVLSRAIATALAAGAFTIAVRRGDPQIATQHRDLVDWPRAEAVAQLAAGRGGVPDRDAQSRYEACVEHSHGLIHTYTRIPAQHIVGRVRAVDRAAWISANIGTFRSFVAPLSGHFGRSTLVRPGAMHEINRLALTSQIGILLGYLARRVLGQYDSTIFAAEPERPGWLYFVDPNIDETCQRLRLDSGDFRQWVALHETTHAIQFEGVPWLRGYLRTLIENYVDSMTSDRILAGPSMWDVPRLIVRLGRAVPRRHLGLEALLSTEQRAMFRRVQALMCVVEGHGNHVMDAVGARVLRTYPWMKARLAERRANPGRAERVLARITGLNVKLEQYALGERFFAAVAGRRGVDAAHRVFDEPRNLPDLDEIANPDRWIDRVIPRAA